MQKTQKHTGGKKIVSPVSIAIIAALMILSVCTLRLADAIKHANMPVTVTYSSQLIGEQISEISELSTLKFDYRNAAKSAVDPYKLFGAIDMPFTGKSMIVSYEGVMRMGTDLSKALICVDNDTEPVTISITLQPCKIQSHEIDENSWEFWDTKSSIFNPLTPQDDSNLRKEQKAVMEQLVLDRGLLSEANDKAKSQLSSLLRMLYPECSIKIDLAEE